MTHQPLGTSNGLYGLEAKKGMWLDTWEMKLDAACCMKETLHCICRDRSIESKKIRDLQRPDLKRLYPAKIPSEKKNCPDTFFKAMIQRKHAWTRSCKMIKYCKGTGYHNTLWKLNHFFNVCSFWIKCTYSAPLARSLAHYPARAPLPAVRCQYSRNPVYAFLCPGAN